ncbi:MAG: PEP-CTERM sorting domain-containing protein [Acetobacteraceae bacterium]
MLAIEATIRPAAEAGLGCDADTSADPDARSHNDQQCRSRRILTGLTVLAAALIGAVADASAITLGFDDLDAAPGLSVPVPASYGGLTWNQFSVMDPIRWLQLGHLPGGALHGVVSPYHVALSPEEGPTGFFSATPFKFESAHFTAMWNDGLTITATGYRNGTQVYQTSLQADTTGPTFRVFDWDSVTEVDFTAVGGTYAGYNQVTGTQFVLDDVTINAAVPEPASLAVLCAGLAGIALTSRRSRQPRSA